MHTPALGQMEAPQRQNVLAENGQKKASKKEAFNPAKFDQDAPTLIQDVSGDRWVPLFHHPCTFGSDVFFEVMTNLIRNPNLNSSWLFRADILFEQVEGQVSNPPSDSLQPRTARFHGFTLERILVRRLIPRNAVRDAPLDQTCLMYSDDNPGENQRSMVVYKPHVSSPSDMPFYHPVVQGLAFFHEWNSVNHVGSVSMHYHFFDELSQPPPTKLVRTGLHLLSTLHKHGEGNKAGYVKKVNHDVVVPQIHHQTTYARLKEKYARQLIGSWAEVTDPSKHVFEDLGIAAFLIELWDQMYKDATFPGFVDIGCGNGLLVYVLRQEGYSGWGFDARRRKSWENYTIYDETQSQSQQRCSLRQHVLLPSIIDPGSDTPGVGDEDQQDLIHDGVFPKGTFIISNHADELTPWTPLLATISECPFIMIPCCSHDLSGARFRAPAPKDQGKSASAYSSLVDWVSKIGLDCGWKIETEMLRIPSTRNTCLVGRERIDKSLDGTVDDIIVKYGGARGFADNVMKLVKVSPRGH